VINLTTCTLVGLLSEGELDSRAVDAIKDLTTADALSVLEEFKSSDLPNISNKSALICTLIKSQRNRNRPARHEERGGGDDSRVLPRPGPNDEALKVS